MIYRAPPALPLRATVARRSNFSWQRFSVRSNSSVAAQEAASGNVAPKVPPAARKRSVPVASSFGDIVIPGSNSTHKANLSKANLPSFKPGLSWLENDEFDSRSPLARRLASARHTTDNDAKSVSAPSPADLSRGLAAPSLPSRNQARGDNPRRSEQRNEGHQNSQRVGAERVRSAPPHQDRPERRSWGPRDKQAGAEGRPSNGGRENGRESQPNRGQQQRTDRNSNRQPARRTQARQIVKEEEEEDNVAQDGAPTSTVMEIQTTDLDKLFGAPPTVELADVVVPVKHNKSKNTAMTAAERVQLSLEHRGGDYSRYFQPLPRSADPLNTMDMARLALARQRGAGLKQRQQALEVVQRLVLNEVTARPTA